MAVSGFVEQGHQELAAPAGLVDPLERERLGDGNEVGVMPQKEQYQILLRALSSPPP